ncbi:hypothetical protein COLO4_21639 [Corchorus olitorius]|uniref:F-box domain-containing protein n=1 Tax=Corchorus olitorius TaxID=93759 RepID=A0A1R3IS74_9ROSI|nr:hypothetical protein COLO4_21639 [Corchorus olitorius]
MTTLPCEIVNDILSCLPPKSLQRFKLVSKPWGSLISDPNFVESHLRRAYTISQGDHNANLLRVGQIGGILYQSGDLGWALYHMNSEGLNRKVVMIEHDDFARCIDLAGILGTCNGLFLVLIITRPSKMCILWNPSSRKCKTIPPYHVPSDMALVISGLGYESSSRNYKGVVVYSPCTPWTSQGAYGNKEFLCLVYNYKNNSWTRKYESDYDLFDFSHSWDVATVNGVPHWCVFRIDQQNFSKTYLIVYFDLENENFKVLVGLPEWGIEEMKFHLGVLGDCLCMSVLSQESLGGTEVWAMKEYGISESWMKLFVIPHSSTRLWPLCFRGKKEVLIAELDEEGITYSENLLIFNLKENTLRDFSTHDNYSRGFHFFTYVASLVSPEEHENQL